MGTIRPVAGFLALVAALFGFAGRASAAPISLDHCDHRRCQGLTLSLQVADNGDSYGLRLTLDADDYTRGRRGPNHVGFTAISGWRGVRLGFHPGSSTRSWAEPAEAANSSNNPCAKGTKSYKVCTSGFVDVAGGGEFTREFTWVGSTLLGPIGWHNGGRFADGPRSTRGQIISTAIPEPSAALGFSLGLLFVGRHLGIWKRKEL